jgi:Chaperone for flagella basal body P-ring formation
MVYSQNSPSILNAVPETVRLRSMKPLFIVAWIASFSVLPPMAAGQAACHTTVRASLEVAGREFSLADVLAGDTCPAVRRAAAAVRLGSTPLAGSPRVLAGDEVRAVLEKLSAGMENGAGGSPAIRVPERITVRRAGARSFCAEIEAQIRAGLRVGTPNSLSTLEDRVRPTPEDLSPRAMDCGAADRIPQETPIEFTPPVWDPALASWEVLARCVHPADCVPFRVRVRDRDSQMEIERSARPLRSTVIRRMLAYSMSPGRAALRPGHETPLVRPGETVTLLWDQDGIRLVVPAVALDAGLPGEPVRARIARGGRLVRAIVVSAGTLRAAS